MRPMFLRRLAASKSEKSRWEVVGRRCGKDENDRSEIWAVKQSPEALKCAEQARVGSQENVRSGHFEEVRVFSGGAHCEEGAGMTL